MRPLDPRLQARRIDHVGVIVTDLEAATSDFADRFGLATEGTWWDPEARFVLRYLVAGGTTLQLVQPLGAGPLRDWLEAKGEGLHHLCLEVDDLDAAVDALEGRIMSPAYVSGRGARVCFPLQGVRGVTIELTEPAG